MVQWLKEYVAKNDRLEEMYSGLRKRFSQHDPWDVSEQEKSALFYFDGSTHPDYKPDDDVVLSLIRRGLVLPQVDGAKLSERGKDFIKMLIS
jgi:hypothetical protein